MTIEIGKKYRFTKKGIVGTATAEGVDIHNGEKIPMVQLKLDQDHLMGDHPMINPTGIPQGHDMRWYRVQDLEEV